MFGKRYCVKQMSRDLIQGSKFNLVQPSLLAVNVQLELHALIYQIAILGARRFRCVEDDRGLIVSARPYKVAYFKFVGPHRIL